MSITKQHCQESLCLAHIHALVGMAGAGLVSSYVQDYGVDGIFEEVVLRGSRRTLSGFPLQFQAKATTDWKLEDAHVVYDLESKTYNDIVCRSEAETSLLLVLLCLPADQSDWHSATIDCTTLRNSCYWHVPEGNPVLNEASTKRIRIPTDQLLTPSALRELLSAEKLRRLGQLA